MINAAVSDMSCCAPAFVENQKCEGGSHLLLCRAVLAVQLSHRLVDSIVQILVSQYLVCFDNGSEQFTKRLADCLAGHLSTLVTSHPVTKDEDTMGSGACAMQGNYAIFLIAPCTKLKNRVGLIDVYFHLLLLFLFIDTLGCYDRIRTSTHRLEHEDLTSYYGLSFVGR